MNVSADDLRQELDQLTIAGRYIYVVGLLDQPFTPPLKEALVLGVGEQL